MGAVLDAAALLLDRHGLDGLTTNAVARSAGVSVGSLYRYFPDKISIIAELARRVEATAVAIAAEEMIHLRDASARSATARIVKLSHSSAFGTTSVRRALLREVPRSWILPETRSTDSIIGELLTAFFTARRDQVRPLDTARAVFVVQHAVEGVVEAVLLACADALPSAAVQRELFHLGWGFMAPDHERSEPPFAVDTPASVPSFTSADEALTRRLLEEPSPSRAVQDPRGARSTKSAATRRAIVDSAERMLAREGQDVSVRSIVADAGVSIGAFYHHFPSAELVVAQVATDIELRAAEDLTARLDAGDDPASAIAGAYLETAPDALRRALLRKVPRRWIEESAFDIERVAIARVARAIEERPRRGDPMLMAFTAVHAVKSAVEAYLLLEPPDLDLDGLHVALRELVSAYLDPCRDAVADGPETCLS